MPKPRRILVDAYNVLHVTGVLSPEVAGPDLQDLAELIALSRWASIPAQLICDGKATKAARPPRGVKIVYAGAGKDADSLIESLIERDTAPRSLRIVSSDRRLRNAARRRKASWMSSEDFLRALNHDAGRPSRGKLSSGKPPAPVPEGSVERWLADLGVEPNDPLRQIQSAAGDDVSMNGQPNGRRSPKQTPLPAIEHDPVIEEALNEWRNELDRDDLDMSRWIAGVEPIHDPDESPPSS